MDSPTTKRAKVERRHREAAVRMRYSGAFDIRPSYTDAYEAGLFIERRQDSVADRVLAELADFAQSHADFEAAGYARATKDAQAYIQFALGLPQAADDLEGMAHVGAAEKYADEICADSMEREEASVCQVGASDREKG